MNSPFDTALLIARHQKLIGILNMIAQSEHRLQTRQQLLSGVWGQLIADYRAKRKVHNEIHFQNRVTERLTRYYLKQREGLFV